MPSFYTHSLTLSLFLHTQQYEKYFAANAVQKGGGGSFYLQSKVVRAKEMLDEYIEEHPEGEKDDDSQQQQQKSQQ